MTRARTHSMITVPVGCSTLVKGRNFQTPRRHPQAALDFWCRYESSDLQSGYCKSSNMLFSRDYDTVLLNAQTVCVCVCVLPFLTQVSWGTKQTLSEHCNPAFHRFLALGNRLTYRVTMEGGRKRGGERERVRESTSTLVCS